MSKRKIKKPRKKRDFRGVSLTAASADKHVLYQRSVQDAEITVGFLNQVYLSRRQRQPLRLREDFCGTALLAAQWVKSDGKREATGIDLDEETLRWGQVNNIAPLGDEGCRLTLRQQDVLDAEPSGDFDIVVAFNFSYWVFKQRDTMKRYFSRVRESLDSEGVFVLDLHGGPDAQFQLEEPVDQGDFEYVWDQVSFCPITHQTECRIHFRFRDGSALNDAFVYNWRLWTLPELKDVLLEVGFEKVDVWFDEDNGNDDYAICETSLNMESWIAYVAAWV